MQPVQLTAGNSQGALLSVKRVELEVHGAGKRQGDPGGENAVSRDGRLTYGNIVEEKSEPKFVTEASDVF